jgi:hypothetical protein
MRLPRISRHKKEGLTTKARTDSQRKRDEKSILPMKMLIILSFVSLLRESLRAFVVNLACFVFDTLHRSPDCPEIRFSQLRR